MVATLNHVSSRENIYEKALASLYEKKKVWDVLQKERQAKQTYKNVENKNSLTSSKRIYTIDAVKYYKVVGLDRDFYIQVESLNYISNTQIAVYLCYYTIEGMLAKKAQLKIDAKSNHFFISMDEYKNKFIAIDLETLN